MEHNMFTLYNRLLLTKSTIDPMSDFPNTENIVWKNIEACSKNSYNKETMRWKHSIPLTWK